MKDKIRQILNITTDPSIRFELLEKFSDLASCEDDVRSLIELLENDPDPCVRHEAAAQLYRLEERKPRLMINLREKAVASLLDKACNDESTVVRHESIEVLGYVGGEECLDNLRQLATNEDLDIRSTAEIALRTAERRMKCGIKPQAICAQILASWPEDGISHMA
jgi:HEAT repeat protein